MAPFLSSQTVRLRHLFAAERDPQVLRHRYRALQQQIPLLYAIIIANLIGVHLVTGKVFVSVWHPLNLLMAAVVLRLVRWAFSRNELPSPKRLAWELHKTCLLTAIFSAAFAFWGVQLLAEADRVHETSIVLFATLMAFGCAYGLSGYPAAARLPLLLAALPVSLWLAFSDRPAQVAMGVSLGLVTLLMLRLLAVQNAGIVKLVRSRSRLDREIRRAEAAERRAQRERAKAETVANTDALTGLLNRRAFLAALTEQAEGPKAVAIVDLDGFKPVNDTFGHAAGDEVLIEIGRRLAEMAGEGGLAARMGGDEFALLLEEKDAQAALAVGERLCAAVGRPIAIGGRVFQVSASCGLTQVDGRTRDASTLLRQADMALYRAKQLRRGTAASYSREMDAAANRKKVIEASLKEDEVQESISLLFQPIVDLATGRLAAFEALARWNDPDLGEVHPCEFIQIAEQTNVIESLSGRLLRKAARQARRWPDPVRLSFNVSAAELCVFGAGDRILALLAEEEIAPSRLQVEVTETTMLSDFEIAARSLEALREAGVKVVLDDFGAGFASISYLREMRFDGVKLDGSLIRTAMDRPEKLRLLQGVLGLCNALELPCVAEHVETREQLALLRKHGCQHAQGFLISHPLFGVDARDLAHRDGPVIDLKPERRRAA